MRSRVGRDSMFSIHVPPGIAAQQRVSSERPSSNALAGLRALLDRWKAVALAASTVDEALAHIYTEPDVALVDYHLHDRLDGLGVIAELRRRCWPGTGAKC